MRDTVNMRKLGIPCVGLVHKPFEKLAKLQCAQLGEPDVPFIFYQQDLPAIDTPEELSARANDVAGQCERRVIEGK